MKIPFTSVPLAKRLMQALAEADPSLQISMEETANGVEIGLLNAEGFRLDMAKAVMLGFAAGVEVTTRLNSLDLKKAIALAERSGS